MDQKSLTEGPNANPFMRAARHPTKLGSVLQIETQDASAGLRLNQGRAVSN